MHTGPGQVAEVYLDGSARIDCAPEFIPAPGQYLLAHAEGSAYPLAAPLFLYDSTQDGFRFAAPFPLTWTPGTRLNMRGPLGRGFTLAASARKVALIAWDDSPAPLRGLMLLTLKNNLEVVLVCNSNVQDVPEVVEVQPFESAREVCSWADFIALDVARENLVPLRDLFGELAHVPAAREAQVLIRTPMPCGGLAECGICAVGMHHGWKMTCKDGPVFVLSDLFGGI